MERNQNLFNFIILVIFFLTVNFSYAQVGKKICKNDPKIEKKTDDIFSDFNNDNTPSAGIMVIKSGKIIFQKSYGFADMENKIPAEWKTNYRLASVSKQFTAMCILILKERGKIKLDNTLKDIFPDFPEYGKKITIRNILNHTSGLIDYEDMIPDSQTVQVHDADVLHIMKSVDSTYFIPGTKWKYSNSGYALLTTIIEKITGKRYADFVKENIFKPLKMNETLAFEQGISTVNNRAFGYSEKENKYEKTDQSTTSAVLGDGGIYSSLSDYFKWDQALYTNKLISRKALEEAFTTGKYSDGKPIEPGYGFGWFVSNIGNIRILEHGGSTRGQTHHVIRILQQQLTVIALTNKNNTPKIQERVKSITNLFLKSPLFENK
jgi:CubicO group peptidase (beta-lactamase class C family)